MFRSRRPAWANPEQSVGAKCEKQFGNLNCYEATGRACDAFLEIAPLIKDLLDTHKEDLEKGEQRPRSISFALFMLGTEPSQTQPTIVFASLSQRQRNRAKSLVKEKNLLENHPSIKMKTIPRLPALPRGNPHVFESSKSCSTTDPCENSTAAQGNNKWKKATVLTLDGGGIRGYASLLILEELMHHVARLETSLQYQQSKETLPATGHGNGGGFLQVRDKTYCLSALHPYLDLEVEEDEQEGHQSHDFDFDSDSDDECEDDEIRKPNSQSCLDSLSDSAEIPTLDASYKVVAAAKISQTELDYRVVQVHDIDRSRLNIIHLDGESPRSITPRIVASKAEEQNVIVNTQTTGPVKGRLMRAPRYIKMAGWSTFQEMWVVKMSRDAMPGDCGAWVVEDSDDSHSKFFGHVVAGQPGSFEAYIIPACQIFDDIEKRFGVRPTLPESRDNSVAGRRSSSNIFPPQHHSQRTAFLPCHYFTYIGGTSTGGIIAMMLGRMRMTVEDTLAEYENLGERVFGKPRLFSMRGPIPWFRTKYSHRKFEEAIKWVLQGRRQIDPDGQTVSEDSGFFSPPDRCRTIVCAFGEDLTTSTQQPFLFRNYSHRFSVRSARSRKAKSPSFIRDSEMSHGSNTSSNYESDDISDTSSISSNSSWDSDDIPPKSSLSVQPRRPRMNICEVARATSAAPTYFKALNVEGYRFVDGGVGGFNNPTELAYDEIERTSSRPSLIVSIGTGLPGDANRHSTKSLYGKFKNYLDPSKELSLDSELVHRRMEKLASTAKFSYSRFNAGNAIEDIKMDEWKISRSSSLGTLDTIRQHAEKYLQQADVQERLVESAKALVQRRRQRLLRDLREDSRHGGTSCL